MTTAVEPALLAVENLRVVLQHSTSPVPILRDVSLRLAAGEIVGLVGESGCGKTMLGLSILDLLPHGVVRAAGTITLAGRSLAGNAAVRLLRGREMVMVFQDALVSLSPVLTVGQQMRDVLLHVRGPVERPEAELAEALTRVGVSDPRNRLRQYVHELSGGQRQRVLIAMALLGRPSLIVADEPTSALDTSTEAQVIGLLTRSAREAGAAVLLVTHNLRLVADACDRALVMYAGRIVEDTPVEHLFVRPAHPYTRGLLRSMITLATPRGTLRPIPGRVPLPAEHVSGCRFHPRCEERVARCMQDDPPLEHLTPGVQAACWRAHEHVGAEGA